MTANHQHTPTTEQVRGGYSIKPPGHSVLSARERQAAEFDRWYKKVIAAAEQRGAEQAFRKTQEIIAGFDHTIEEARNRDDMINTGYLIQELDTEIQDLMEGDDD